METITRLASLSHLFVDKDELARMIDAVNAETGFVPVPGATAERSREMARADGVDPNDNEFARGIVEMREE